MTDCDDDSPQARAEAGRGARIIIDALRTNGARTLDDLFARPDARKLINEAADRVAAAERNETP